jgi:acetylglutamate kinase
MNGQPEDKVNAHANEHTNKLTHEHARGHAEAAPIIVVKLGGRTQGDAALPAAIGALWSAWHGRVAVVHGGGDQISVLQQQRGETPRFVGGRRVTTEQALDVVRMALSGLANKQLVSAFVAQSLPAVGVSGEDAGLLRATPIDEATFGFAGTPVSVQVRLLTTLLDAGFLPVISPVAAHVDTHRAQAMNVNGDDAAAAIAAALGAQELFFMADVPAVRDANGAPVHRVTPGGAATLIANGVAAGGMAAKLEAGTHALEQGVSLVRIGDLAALTQRSAGTSLVSA